MVAAIASIRGHDIDQPEVRSAVLLALVSADADDLLGKAGHGVSTTGRPVSLVAQRLPGPVLMAMKAKGVVFRLLGLVRQELCFIRQRPCPWSVEPSAPAWIPSCSKRISSAALRQEVPARPRAGTDRFDMELALLPVRTAAHRSVCNSLLRVAHIDKRGYPIVTPMFYVIHDGFLQMSSIQKHRHKVHHLMWQRDLISASHNDGTCLLIRGRPS